MIGQTISHYKILAKLSEDGTGILYRAVDTEVDRAVAIKVLSAGILANPERRQRLEHSAKAASGLEHPNIARLHEFVHADGAGFVVLDAPEGESLYDFLDRERPRRRDLVRFARQMARALAAAHGAGIIHGPLNPDSIFINAKLQIRFYDFGFGVVEPPPDGEGARQSLFGHGIPYVSPEQVRGASPDARSDIFSLGALLYHMTTGLPAFRTGAVSETWKAIVEAEPKPIAQVTSRAPRGMAKLVERCLRKNPQLRFQQFGEIEPLLEQMAETFDQNPNSQSSSLGKNWGRIAKIGGFALAAAAGIAAAVLWRQRPPAPDAVTGAHFRQITQGAGYDTEPAASADGTFLAYASDRNSDGNLNIWIQQADGNEARQLTDDPADDREPAFAPDGETIAFRSERDGGGVFLVPAKGGPARLLAREGRRPRYSPDGRWIAYWVGPAGFAPKADRAYATFVIPAAGGAPRQLRPDFASSTYPVWSPDSKRLLFLGQPDAGRNDPDSLEWWVASLDGGQLNNTGACTLFRGAGVLPYTQMALPGDWKGNSVFFSIPATEGANIWRAGMAPDKLDVTAKPVRVTSGKGMEIQPHALVDGRVAFSRQSYNADIWGIPLSANEGKLNGDPKRWTRDPGIDIAPSLTADGTKLLFQSNRTGHYEPWLVEVPGGKDTRVTASAQDQLFPVISPDGSKVAYSEHRIRRFEQFFRPLGAGTAELLCDDCGAAVSGWSRDGKAVLIDSLAADKSHLSVSLIRLGAEGKTLLLEDTRYDVSQARFSPDGRWIVFVVRMGGVSRLYLTSYHDRTPLPSKEWIPLTDGKTWETSPQWSPDGKLVYFTSTRDGYRCVWAQHLDAANKPSGPAFAVAHFHTARSSPARLPFDNMDLFVGRDQILVSLGDLTGNIWMCTTSK